MNSREEIVRDLIVKVSETPKAITPEKHLIEDLGFDSVTFMELIACLEDEFDACIPITDLDKILTVKGLYSIIEDIDKYSLDLSH